MTVLGQSVVISRGNMSPICSGHFGLACVGAVMTLWCGGPLLVGGSRSYAVYPLNMGTRS